MHIVILLLFFSFLFTYRLFIDLILCIARTHWRSTYMVRMHFMFPCVWYLFVIGNCNLFVTIHCRHMWSLTQEMHYNLWEHCSTNSVVHHHHHHVRSVVHFYAAVLCIVRWHEENALLSTVNRHISSVRTVGYLCGAIFGIIKWWTSTCCMCNDFNWHYGDDVPLNVQLIEKPEMRLCAMRKCLLLHLNMRNYRVGPVGEGGNGCARISCNWRKKIE